MITSKEQIINYFKSGIKSTKNFKIGIEHEKFLFNNKDNKRIDYLKIKEMFAALLEFGWKPILEKGNIIGLNNFGKNNCANSVYHGITISLDMVNDNPLTLNIMALRSFAGSFHHAITDASLEFGFKAI